MKITIQFTKYIYRVNGKNGIYYCYSEPRKDCPCFTSCDTYEAAIAKCIEHHDNRVRKEIAEIERQLACENQTSSKDYAYDSAAQDF